MVFSKSNRNNMIIVLSLLFASTSCITEAFLSPALPTTSKSMTTEIRMTSDYYKRAAKTTSTSAPSITAELTVEQQQEKLITILNQQKSTIATASVDAPKITVTKAAQAAPTATKKTTKKKNPLEDMSNDEGLFAPAVLLTKNIVGTKELNALRARIIKEHTNVIGKLTETSDSAFGDTVLKLLFDLADKDGNGTIDEAELQRALNAIGCGFIPEQQINGMFKRADKDGNCGLDYEEWCQAAPKTLKTALVKLAKKNGHELGFLA
mmetsp:Transcript_46733/g.50412  ORF Transcript_46733/g.50412 Transcript_46733/m.50412 type:complete len:265 (-) Transcript_46733:278-1072(-)